VGRPAVARRVAARRVAAPLGVGRRAAARPVVGPLAVGPLAAARPAVGHRAAARRVAAPAAARAAVGFARSLPHACRCIGSSRRRAGRGSANARGDGRPVGPRHFPRGAWWL
jgi:hypothetical protein